MAASLYSTQRTSPTSQSRQARSGFGFERVQAPTVWIRDLGYLERIKRCKIRKENKTCWLVQALPESDEQCWIVEC